MGNKKLNLSQSRRSRRKISKIASQSRWTIKNDEVEQETSSTSFLDQPSNVNDMVTDNTEQEKSSTSFLDQPSNVNDMVTDNTEQEKSSTSFLDQPSNINDMVTHNTENICNNIPVTPPMLYNISGRRIIDFQYLFKQIVEIGKHSPFDCSASDMNIISEKRVGLQSTFVLKCKMCNMEVELCSENFKDTTTLGINSAAVVGIISVGCGFSQMNELHATLNIPPMTYRTYANEHNKLIDVFHNTAWKSMEEAGKEEAKLARELGHVDKDGYPLITVIADGAWCKRSYKTNYDASSGVGCIIGEKTGKLLFLGVRNKYCAMCSRAEAKNSVPPEHMCFKNWNASSTSMEADIIVEGFKKSVELHGVKFSRLVGDGDSSVMRKLQSAKPYGTLLVEKVECRNHLLRNFCNKIQDLCSKRISSLQKPIPPYLRSLLEKNKMRLRGAVTKAVKYRKDQDSSLSEKISGLVKDLLNCSSHIFGEHAECSQIGYFCSGLKDGENNSVPPMKECGLFQDLQSIFYRLVHNASSLILNMTNNAAEQYNSVLCKFIGGKRINFSLKGSYQARCLAAVLSYNSKEQYHSVVHKAITSCSPGSHTKKYISRLTKRYENIKKRKLFKIDSNIPVKRKRVVRSKGDTDYGPAAVNQEESDMPVDLFEEKKAQFLEELKKTDEEIVHLEFITRGQSKNPLWKQERSLRITASNFGAICKMRNSTSCTKTVERLLYGQFCGTEATRYGIEHEHVAIESFQDITKLSVVSCGLFIGNRDEFCLGCSPDGLIGNDAIVEVKCPAKASKLSPFDACSKGILDFMECNAQDKTLKLKKNHNYMYQVQGQLHLTGRNLCYFVVWTPLATHIEKIERDLNFWETKMKKTSQHILPQVFVT